MQRFGAAVLSERIVEDARDRPDALHEFLHVVLPNDAPDRMAWNYRGMRFSSYDVCRRSREIGSEGRFRTFHYAVGRYTTGPKEVYGRSPTMTLLREIKMVQEMTRTILKAGQKALDPHLLLQETGALSAFNLRPGALNFDGVDDAGNPTLQALKCKGDIAIGDERIARRQQSINEAFLVNLTQVLVAVPQMTAAEVVLADLKRFCRADTSTVVVSPVSKAIDPLAMAMAEGRREVWNRIQSYLHMADREITQLKEEDP